VQSTSNRARHSNYHTDQDEIAALKRRLTIHRRNLYELEEQKAKHGLDVPVHIINEIAEQKEAIAQIEARLAELEGSTSAPQTSPRSFRPDQGWFVRVRVWWHSLPAAQQVAIVVALISLLGVLASPVVNELATALLAGLTPTKGAMLTPTLTPTLSPIGMPATTTTLIPADALALALNDTIAYYDFNVASKNDTQCWRVRTMLDGVPLGTAVKPAPGKGRYGSGALEFKFTLLLAQSGVGGAQIDQMGEGPNCAKSVPMIPSTGQVELWVYLDAGASEGEGVTLQAEPFFAPINVIPAWLYGPAVGLKPNQWNRVCWDRSNSPSGVGFGGDDWSGQLQAFGLEIKFADPAPTTPYVGIVYIDDVRLIGNAEGEACP
jgi:hypothetical protein